MKPLATSAGGRRLVALTATVHEQAGRHQQTAVFLYASYLQALEEVGLAPVLLTPAHSAASVRSLMAVCDGLVLTGGEDVEPARFLAQPLAGLGTVSRDRDTLEWQALDLALARQLPVLGICRGLQVLNVYFGGTLYQDLPTELPGQIDHDPANGLGARVHPVSIAEGSRLHRILGAREILTNSSHHQAVRDLAPCLAVTARSRDGVTEAVEASGGGWVLGVQWHPERRPASSPADDPDRLLFHAFQHAVVQRAEASPQSGPAPGQVQHA